MRILWFFIHRPSCEAFQWCCLKRTVDFVSALYKMNPVNFKCVCMTVRTCWCSNAIGQFVHSNTLESLLFQSSALANQIFWMKFIDPQTREQYPCSYTQPPTGRLHIYIYCVCTRHSYQTSTFSTQTLLPWCGEKCWTVVGMLCCVLIM